MSAALIVDLYELTMAQTYWREGLADRPSTFSLFVRSLPPPRGYLIAAGLVDALDWLHALHFDSDDLAVLERLERFDPAFLDWLSGLRFTGDVRAVPEGTIVWPPEPILEVDAPIVEGQLAETFLLNQVTLQTTLATKASRLRHAAGGRSVADFGLRRAPGIDAGMKAARCCRLVGIDATSNVAGADRYGLAVSGTMAHSFVEAYVNETDAFVNFARHVGGEAVLLVDTYDTMRGVEHAIAAARNLRAGGIEITGIRLDSGDLATFAQDARQRLDRAGFPDVRIFASGGLDEHSIAKLLNDDAPIDGFGVGTSLVTSSDAPTLDSVYKLVAFDGRLVHKTSVGKATLPGPKQVWRSPAWTEDVITLADERTPHPGFEPLLETVMRDGERTAAGSRTLADSRQRFEQQWRAIPDRHKHLAKPAPYSVSPSHRLAELARIVAIDR